MTEPGRQGALRVLAADDDPGTRLMLAAAVERLGHACTVVDDGHAAWVAWLQTRPDVVIADWDMPGLDGATLAQRIRAEPADTYAYIIVLTANLDPDDARRTMQAGADDLLFKPLDAAELERKLIAAGRVTALHRERRRAAELLRVQHDVARVLAEAVGVEDTIRRVLAVVAAGIGWQAGIWWRFEETAQTWSAGPVWPGDEARLRVFAAERAAAILGTDDGLPGWTREDVGPIWSADLGAAIGSPRAEAARAAGLRGALAIPVVSAGGVTGVLELFAGSPAEPPDDRLLVMLATIGRQIGQFVERRGAEREAERLKDEFFALVSHELRTPLTSISGYLELLLDDEPDEQRRRFLGVIDRNARRLHRLVGDMLFVAQVEAGRLTLDRREVDLGGVVSAAVEAAAPQAAGRGVALTAHVDPVGLRPGDPDRLGQALDNLVANAIKYTPPSGRVEVRLREDATQAVIEVRDTGPGIPPAQQARVFERFFRGSSAVANAIPGVGLGLTIATAIVEGHGGALTVTSEEGAGTSFRIELPLAPPEALTPAARPRTCDA